MEGELIYLGFIMLIGQIILMQMWQANWFKKENFKIKKKMIEGENRLKLNKLEKELGLKQSKESKEKKSLLDSAGQWLPLLSKLDEDQIAVLFDKFLGEGEETDRGGLEDILDAIPEDVIKGFLDGLGKKEEKPPTRQNY